VDLDQNVVQCTSQELPRLDEPAHLKGQDPKELLLPLIGEAQIKQLWEFLEKTPEENQSRATFQLEQIEDKDKRTQVHQAIKLVKTVRSRTQDGKIIVEFLKKKPVAFQRLNWPKETPFLEFVLVKCNLDTSNCIGQLANSLHIKPNRIAWAGTKDKRAITTQKMTGLQVSAEQLLKVTQNNSRITVGNFRLVESPLRLGDLYGNRFSILVRNVEADPQQIEQAVQQVKEQGFINYYGTQRFGTGSVRSHQVGMAVLRSDWKSVVELLLSPDNREQTKKALQMYVDGAELKEVVDNLPSPSLEKTVVLNLIRNGRTAYANAFSALPRNMRLLYIHAVQSFIWNEVATVRISKFGTALHTGDLVVLSESETKREETSEDEPNVLQTVHALTEEDVASGKWTIFDVVLPQPGQDVQYPTFLRDNYAELLKACDLDIDNITHKIKDYRLSGSYRNLLQKPIDLTSEIIKYNSEDIAILHSDLDRMKNKPAPERNPDGNCTGVVLNFTLPRSTYATICLREIMKYPVSMRYF